MDDELEDLWDSLPLVERVAERIGVDPDLVSELGLNIIRQCRASYSPTKGTFKSYVNTSLANAFRRYKRTKREVSMLEGEEFRQKEASSLNVVGPEMSIEQVQSSLTEEEYQLLLEWHSGVSREVLMHKYGRTRQYLWQWVQRIQRKVHDVSSM